MQGHLLGSSSIEIWVTEDGETRKLVFSGDIGNCNRPLIRDPEYLEEADYVIMESLMETAITIHRRIMRQLNWL